MNNNSKISVLMITSTFPRWDGDTTPSFVFDLAKRINTLHKVDVLAPHYKGSKLNEDLNGVSVFRFKYFIEKYQSLAYEGGILQKLKNQPYYAVLIPFFFVAQTFSTYRLIKKNKYNIIHCHWIIPQGLTFLVLRLISKRARETKFIVTSHGADLFSLDSPLLNNLKKRVAISCDHLSVVSRSMLTRSIELGFPRNKIGILSMGADIKSLFVPPPSDVRRTGIVFVGRLVPKKGVEYLVEALSILKNCGEITNTTIVGHGPCHHNIEEKARRLGVIDQLHFAGPVTNDVVPSFLQKAKVAVFPFVETPDGDQEGLGLTVVEAMGCGCRVVAFGVPALKDTLENNETGYIVEPRNTAELANSIKKAQTDSRKNIVMEMKARQSALRHFDWDIVSQKHVELYINMLAN